MGEKGRNDRQCGELALGNRRDKTKATAVGLSDDCQTDGVRNERVQYSNNATFLVRRRKRASGIVDVDREKGGKAAHFCLEGEPQSEFDLTGRAQRVDAGSDSNTGNVVCFRSSSVDLP